MPTSRLKYCCLGELVGLNHTGRRPPAGRSNITSGTNGPPRTTRGSFAHPNYLTGSLLRAGGGQATVPQWRSRLTGSGAVPRIAAKGEALRGGRKQNEQHAYAVRLPHYSLIGDQGVGSQLFWTSFAGACPAFALQGWTGDAMIT
ncbi:hypothetical protein PoMZ_06355 [Pyricularia oryzae]|uniref:Uncharacterized protein n=1 Tax=Pyricularia oryzae TaxID=318829 RepID=A0A4P7NQN3_PYROR|nr:hypothetical protein PoMZ_06355 [Pyricularia oryzae]